MTDPAERQSRLLRLRRNVLVFLSAALAALAALGVAVAIKQGTFKQVTPLYFFAPTAHGINKNMAVSLSGFRIGTVEEIRIEDTANVKVKILIDSEYTRLIRQDSKVRLTKEGLIGATQVEIVPGTPQARGVAANDVLAFERARDFAELAQELTGEIKPILQDIKRITASINDPQGDIHQTIGNVNRMSASMAATAEQLRLLVGNANAKLDTTHAKLDLVLDKFAERLDVANEAIGSFGRSMAIIEGRLPALLLKLETNLDTLQSIGADVKKVSTQAASDLPALINDGRALVEDAREITNGVKKSWPVRNMIPVPREQALPVDSYDLQPAPPK